MDETSIFTVLASVVTTLGSSKAWEFYSKRTEDRRIEKEDKMNDQNLYRDDLRRKVKQLEKEMRDVNREKETEILNLLTQIKSLSTQLAAMGVRVEFLERENEQLRDSLG
jgi:hypothetical protein